MYTSSILSWLFCMCLLSTLLALAPPAIYESYGPNQVFKDEGQPILSPSGKDFVAGVTLDDCARLCWRSNKCANLVECQCDCCNSFAYKGGSDSKCYLKKRAKNSIDDPYTHPDGFQSFKYFPLTTAPFYTGDLPETVNVQIDLPYDAFVEAFYSTKGVNKVAKNEGSTIYVNSQPYFKTGVSASQCATECQSTQGCEGFSYNPNQQGGKCYFKTGLPKNGKYATKNSRDGWTFYWKERDASKCYCGCQSRFTCLQCTEGKCCEIDGRIKC